MTNGTAAKTTANSSAELRRYLQPAFWSPRTVKNATITLADEPLAADWRTFAAEAQTAGAFTVLTKHLVQLRFPLRAGISSEKDYQRATRAGVCTAEMPLASGLQLLNPDGLELFVHRTVAGSLPVVVVNEHEDFASIVCALCYRNEPRPIPKSMGAALIKGINNWTRIKCLKHRLFLGNGGPDWQRQKSDYQDSLMVLSRIPYSNVPAETFGFSTSEWLEKSLRIRLAHESAHYFTLRHFQRMQVNVYDELLADYLGITAGWSEFRAEIFLRLLGLNDDLSVRPDGRINNYLGSPALEPAARRSLFSLLRDAARNVERFDRRVAAAADPDRSRRLWTLCGYDLPSLARPGVQRQLLNTFHQLELS